MEGKSIATMICRLMAGKKEIESPLEPAGYVVNPGECEPEDIVEEGSDEAE